MDRILFFDGIKKNQKNFNFDLLVNQLILQREYMHGLKISEILDFFEELIKYWNKEGLIKKHLYLRNLTEFLSRKNLEKKLEVALRGNYAVLDGFCDLGDFSLLFHAQPRGIVVQWLAGNVSILGLFSIFSALITKNVCLVKASTREYKELINFLETLNKVKTKNINGKILAKSVVVVLIDRKDLKIHEKLSLAADIRIAWGGEEAIETILGLKKKYYCEDIILGPKYSYALIDKESLEKDRIRLAQKLAVDISVFDQYACSSPHTIFVQAEKTEVLKFAQILGQQMEFINRTILPKNTIDSGKAMEIINLRSIYEIKGKVYSSKGTDWTVIYTEEEGLSKGCFSRVVFVKPIRDISKLKRYNDRRIQTLGVGLTKSNKLKYLDKITLNGIDRCPDLGYLTFFDSVWDGMFVFDRLVRWVSVYK